MTIEFRILGPLEVVVDGEPMNLPQPKQRALLAAMIIHADQPLTTDQLIDELWPDETPGGGVGTLRYHISKLRDAFRSALSLAAGGETPIVTESGAYRLTIGEDTTIDTVRFEALREQAADIIDHDPSGAATILREALQLFRGPPLADFAYEAFAESEIRRLEEERLTVLEQRIEADIASGRHADVIGELTSLVNEHKYRETLRGHLMVALYRSGRQAEALRAFEEARRVLGDEFGLEPTRELRELEDQILLQTLAPAPVRLELPDSLQRTTDVELVDRTSEMGGLLGLIDDASRGRKRLVLISGEAGVGKSRLSRELAQRAHQDGALVLYGRCERDIQPDLRPLAEVVRYVAREAEQAETLFDAATWDLVRLVPELRDVVGEESESFDLDPSTARFRLQEALVQWFHDLSQQQTVVLVIESLNWADAGTLAAIRYITQSPTPLRLLVVGTARTEIADQTEPFRKHLSLLTRDQAIVRVELSGLELEDSVEYVRVLAKGDIDAQAREFVQSLHAHTNGNPFFIREVLRHLTERGDLQRSEAGVLTTRLGGEELSVPATVEEAVRERLGILDETAQQTLEMAAVIGPEFPMSVLYRTAAAAPESVGSALDMALDARLIRYVDNSRTRYRFSHALVREALRASVPEYRRRAWHGLIGEALEAVYHDHSSLPFDELSYHFSESEQPDSVERTREHARKAVEYAERGAELATENRQAAEAVRLYHRALSVLARPEVESSPRLRCLTMLELGRAERRAGDRAARATLLETCRLADELDEPEILALAALANTRGLFSIVGGVDTERVRWLRRALDAPERTDSTETSMLLAQLSVELKYAEPWEDGYRRAAAALEAGRRNVPARGRTSQDLRKLLRIMNDYHAVIWRPDMLDKRQALIDEMTELAEEADRPEWRWTAVSHGFQWAMESGNMLRADAALKEMTVQAEFLRQPTIVQWTQQRRAVRAVAAGNLRESETLAFDGYARAQAAGFGDAGMFLLGQLWIIRYHQGRLDEITDEFAAAADATPTHPVLPAGLAAIHAESGRPEETREALTRLAPTTFALVDHDYLATLVAVSVAASYVEDEQLSEQALDSFAPFRGQFIDNGTTYHGSAAHFMGILAASLRRFDEADAHFAFAVEQNRGLPAWPNLARSLVEWSSSLAPRDPEQATELAEEAAGLAEDYDLPAVRDRAAALLDA